MSAQMDVDEGLSAVNASTDVQFDLDAYANQYTGHARTDRLVFIAQHAPPEIAGEAARMAVDLLKTSMNSDLYRKATELYEKHTGHAVPGVQDHVVEIETQARAVKEKLEVELTGYKTNLIKESIRMGHNDLGDFFYERGQLEEALQSYVRTRDYCTASKHMIQMCLNVIKVSIELGNYVHVAGYVNKAELTPDISDTVIASKLKAAAGLAELHFDRYKTAAHRFVAVSPEIDTQYNSVIAAQDIALYGGLCALASLDRDALREHVINNAPFRSILELVPDVRELVSSFFNSNYATCMRYMDKIKNDVALDIHLRPRAGRLLTMIRNKALVQYFSPFSSVRLPDMASAFNTTAEALEAEISRLIIDGQLKGRIDTQNKVLYAHRIDPRRETFKMAQEYSQRLIQRTRRAILRVNLLRNDITIQSSKDGTSQRGDDTQGSAKGAIALGEDIVRGQARASNKQQATGRM